MRTKCDKTMYEKELQHLGLAEKEARVYVAALELGPDTVQNIAKKSGINRATAYVQIESLKEKGLMSEFQKDKKMLYIAESPDRLESLLRVFEKELEFKKDELKRFLPILQGLAVGAKERPKVRFYEGLEGFRAVNADYLKAKRKVTESFINLNRLLEISPKHETEYSPQRVQKKIQSYIIYTSKNGPQADMTDLQKMRQAKYIAHDKLPIDAHVTIYDDKVALVAYTAKPVSVIIESKEIADTVRGIFYVIWNSL